MNFSVKVSAKKSNKVARFIYSPTTIDTEGQYIKAGSFRSDYDCKVYPDPRKFLNDLWKAVIVEGNPIEEVKVDGSIRWERLPKVKGTYNIDHAFVGSEKYKQHLLDGRLWVKELVHVNF